MNPSAIPDLLAVLKQIKEKGFQWGIHSSVYIVGGIFIAMIFLFQPLKSLIKNNL